MKKIFYFTIITTIVSLLINCNYYYDPPKANFILSDSIINIGESINFRGKNTNFDNSHDDYQWTISGANNTITKTGQNIEIDFDKAGNYDVTLKIVNRGGQSTYTKYNAITVKNNQLYYILPEESPQYFFGNPLRSTSFYSYNFDYTYPIIIKNIEHTFYLPINEYWDNEDVQMSIKDIVTEEFLYISPIQKVSQYSVGYDQMLHEDFYVPDDLVIEHNFCITITALDDSSPYSPYSLGQENIDNHSCYDHDFEFATVVTIEELGGKKSQIIGR